MADLTGAIKLLGDRLEAIFFDDIVNQLERVPEGKGLMALLALVTAQVIDENGQAVKFSRLKSFIRACKKRFPPDQRQEVIDLLQKDWDNVEPAMRREVLSALIEGPDTWDLSSLVQP